MSARTLFGCDATPPFPAWPGPTRVTVPSPTRTLSLSHTHSPPPTSIPSPVLLCSCSLYIPTSSPLLSLPVNPPIHLRHRYRLPALLRRLYSPGARQAHQSKQSHVSRGAGRVSGVGQERVRHGRLRPARPRARRPPPPPRLHRPRRHLWPLPRRRGGATTRLLWRRRRRGGAAQALPRRPLRLPQHRRRRPRLLRPLLHVQRARPGSLRRGHGRGGGPGGAERAGGLRADGHHGAGRLHLLRHRRRLEGRPQPRRRIRREELERPQLLQETQAVACSGQDTVGEDGLGLGNGQRGGHGGHQRRRDHGAGPLQRSSLPQGSPRDVRGRRPCHCRRRVPRRGTPCRLRVPHRVRPLPLLQQRHLPTRGCPRVRPEAFPIRSTIPAE